MRAAFWIHTAIQIFAVRAVLFYLEHLQQRFRFESQGTPLPEIVVLAFRFHHVLWLCPVVALLFSVYSTRSPEIAAARFPVFSAASLLVLVALASLAMLVSIAPFIYPFIIMEP